MEGWTTIMYLVSIHFLTDKIKMIDSGSPAVAIIYFNLLIFIGSYFLMNIVVAVIITSYAETKSQDDQTKKALNEDSQHISTEGSEPNESD